MSETVQPRLRFPEFKENWNESLLGSIASFSKGKGISKSDIDEDGSTECIRYGELYTHYGEVIREIISRTNLDVSDLVLSTENDVIIPASGETKIDIATASCVMKSGIALGGDLNIIKSPLDGIFLSYYLNNKKKHEIASIAQGISVVHLYATQLKSIILNIPPKKEQQKIATFLRSIDEHINLLKRKKVELERYKYGVMQKIFSQKVRFKDKNGKDFPNWEEKKLEEIIDYEQPTKYLVSSTEYKDKYETPVLTAGKTFLLGYTDETEGVFVENLPTIIFDDFTTAFQFVDFPFKAKSSAMKMLIPKHSKVNIRFVYEAMKTIQFPLAEHKRYWISEYQNEYIPFPSFEEQNKIIDFTTSIDNTILNVEKEIEFTKFFKIGLLQKMFV
jgi:type I restriction enzyme S subunit